MLNLSRISIDVLEVISVLSEDLYCFVLLEFLTEIGSSPSLQLNKRENIIIKLNKFFI